MSSTVLLTGGAGFIGSALVRYLINDTDTTVVNVDKLTYAGSLHSLGGADASERHHFHQEDIIDVDAMRQLVTQYQPDYIMHLAAESHVDRSIDGPGEFIQTNIVGTYNLLQVAREYHAQLDDAKKAAFKFHHISTDEVYGSLNLIRPIRRVRPVLIIWYVPGIKPMISRLLYPTVRTTMVRFNFRKN